MNNHCVKKLSSDDFKYENVFISQENSMQRVIEYAGKIIDLSAIIKAFKYYIS